MTRQHVSRTNQQSKGDTSLVSGILQRAAVRTVPEKEVQPTQEVEATTFRESRFHHNFSQVPASTSEMPRIQPKLKIGAVVDRYEQEADRVAQDVVQRINAPAPERGDEDKVMRKTQEGTLQREEMLEEDEEELRMKPMVQRLSAEGGMAAPPDLDSSIQRARGGGQPLGDGIREPMERAFGTDFSGVRVHTDANSDQLNQSIQAKAFTTGSDIFFRQGAYEPGSRGGQELIAHELTHVVQQNGGAVQRSPLPPQPLLQHPATETPSASEGDHVGYSLHDVRVHSNSEQPTKLQAQAHGTNIHVVSGQERHLYHEERHKVQNKQQTVAPTKQHKRVRINDDHCPENEAGTMGANALGLPTNSKSITRKKQQVSDIGLGIIQRYGTIRFANLDSSKQKYREKADDIIDTLSHTPVIQNFLANKNVLITLKLNLSAGATVTVVGEQVQIELSPWFFEQQSRGRIIGMLAHELGVHPVADENLTHQERIAENTDINQRTALQIGLNNDTIAYDGSNQADHVFASLQGRERFNVYQETVYGMVSRMLANQQNTHITNAHISDVIMTYLADMAMILATNDHRGRLLNNLERAALYFNHLRINWLAFLGTKQNNGQQLIALTPGIKTAGDVTKEVGGVVSSFIVSMFTSSTSDAKEKQRQNQGVWNDITQNQTEILADYNLQLQQAAFNLPRPSFFETLDAARNQPQGTTALLAQQGLQGVLGQPNLQAADITKIQNYIIAIQNSTYVGAVPDNLIYVLEQLLPYSIRVIAPNGQMAHYGNNQVVTLLLVPKPNEHYRYAS